MNSYRGELIVDHLECILKYIGMRVVARTVDSSINEYFSKENCIDVIECQKVLLVVSTKNINIDEENNCYKSRGKIVYCPVIDFYTSNKLRSVTKDDYLRYELTMFH